MHMNAMITYMDGETLTVNEVTNLEIRRRFIQAVTKAKVCYVPVDKVRHIMYEAVLDD